MAKGGKWKDRIVGNYNWGSLCMPTPPWRHERPLPPFFGHNEKLSAVVAIVMGLQHALAMARPLNLLENLTLAFLTLSKAVLPQKNSNNFRCLKAKTEPPV